MPLLALQRGFSSTRLVQAPTGQPSIVISPHDPPVFSSLPATWTPTVTVAGLAQVKWAVFQVSASNPPNYSSTMTYQVVNIPGGNGSFSPVCSMLFPRDILVVKNPAETIEDVSGPTVTTALPPPGPTPDPEPGAAPLRGILRGQSNAILMDYYNGIDHAWGRYNSLTGRSLSLYYNRFDPPGRTMFSGTAFLDQWIPNGWEAEIQRVNEYLSSDRRQAPFVILWMHNESDQVNSGSAGNSKDDWKNAVRNSCNNYRGNIGRSAGEARVIFIKVKYPYGNPTLIFEAMNELAADGSFNAMVTDIAYNQPMTGGPESNNPGTSHLSEAEARDTGDKLGDLLASLYPG